MPAFSTPDVYVREIKVFPPSVAEVESAIPAFIGYTEKATRDAADDLVLTPTTIFSLTEFEQYYGGPKVQQVDIGEAKNGIVTREPDLIPAIGLAR